jgi:hypothetical protein
MGNFHISCNSSREQKPNGLKDASVNLKRLSHEIDFKNVGTRLVFKFLRGSGDFIVQKVYLLGKCQFALA